MQQALHLFVSKKKMKNQLVRIYIVITYPMEKFKIIYLSVILKKMVGLLQNDNIPPLPHTSLHFQVSPYKI